jgi:hypothetical protein
MANIDESKKTAVQRYKKKAKIYFCIPPISGLVIYTLAAASEGFFDVGAIAGGLTFLFLTSIIFIPLGFRSLKKMKRVEQGQLDPGAINTPTDTQTDKPVEVTERIDIDTEETYSGISPLKRVLLVGGVIAACIIFAVVVVNFIEDEFNAPPRSSHVSRDTEPLIVDVDMLVDALSKNALNASNTYKDQYVEVTGRLSTIDSSGKYFGLDPINGWSLTNFLCYITSEQLEIVAGLERGDIVTVRGAITNVGEVLGYAMTVDSFVGSSQNLTPSHPSGLNANESETRLPITLTQTFTDDSAEFSIMFPDNWTILTESTRDRFGKEFGTDMHRLEAYYFLTLATGFLYQSTERTRYIDNNDTNCWIQLGEYLGNRITDMTVESVSKDIAAFMVNVLDITLDPQFYDFKTTEQYYESKQGTVIRRLTFVEEKTGLTVDSMMIQLHSNVWITLYHMGTYENHQKYGDTLLAIAQSFEIKN